MSDREAGEMVSPEDEAPREAVTDLLHVLRQLRDPKSGCPWDLRQDFASIAPYTVEEAYEVADAIERNDTVALCEELGDLLLQVVFHAQMATEQGLFDFAEVARGVAAKMRRRHPHVFSPERSEDEVSVEDVRESWESIKQAEKRGETAGVLGNVPLAMPALTRAEKLSKRAAGIGFDFAHADAVAEKVEEELAEWRAAPRDNRARREEELGDLLFAVANLARHEGVDPESALRRANNKFVRRFSRLEQSPSIAADLVVGRKPSMAVFEAAWEMAKATEK